jgi:hypothetical protein
VPTSTRSQPYPHDVTDPVRPGRRRLARAAAAAAVAAPSVILMTATLVTATAISASADGLATIQITPERTTLRADGRSTSLGRLDTQEAVTQSGVAHATLTAPDIPGSAVVTVNLDGDLQAAPASITISFTADAAASETGTNWVHIDGAYVGYISDYHIVQANGRRSSVAHVTFRSLSITADTLQIQAQTGLLTAVGNVVLRLGGGERRTYNAVKYQLSLGQGIAEKLQDGVPVPVLIQAGVGRIDEAPLPVGRSRPGHGDWQLKDVSMGNIAIVARSIALNPGVQIQFRRATFYFGGQKTLSLPFHVMDLASGQLFREQVIGLGPTGVSVNFPLYYDMRPDGSGTVFIRRSAAVGSSVYSAVPGWHADLVQAYNTKNGADGTFELDNLAQKDWGMQFRAGQALDPATHGSLFVDMPNPEDLFVTTQVQRDFRRFTVNVMGNGTHEPGVVDPLTDRVTAAGGTLGGQVVATGDPRVFLGDRALRYSLSAGAGGTDYYGFATNEEGTLNDDDVQMRVFTLPLRVARNTVLQQSVAGGEAWIGGSALQKGLYAGTIGGTSLLGTTSVDRSLGMLGHVGMTYNYSQQPQTAGTTGEISLGRQQMGANVYLGNDSKISLSVNASQGLDSETTQVYSNLLVGLGGPWRGRITLTSTRYGSNLFNDQEFALVRNVAGRDVAIYYSTTARRFMFDFSGLRF